MMRRRLRGGGCGGGEGDYEEEDDGGNGGVGDGDFKLIVLVLVLVPSWVFRLELQVQTIMRRCADRVWKSQCKIAQCLSFHLHFLLSPCLSSLPAS